MTRKPIASWTKLDGGGIREAQIVKDAQSAIPSGPNVDQARPLSRVTVLLPRNCAVRQFHDTSNA